MALGAVAVFGASRAGGAHAVASLGIAGRQARATSSHHLAGAVLGGASCDRAGVALAVTGRIAAHVVRAESVGAVATFGAGVTGRACAVEGERGALRHNLPDGCVGGADDERVAR